MITLKRRGFSLGTAKLCQSEASDPLENWHSGLPVLLKKALLRDLDKHRAPIKHTEKLVHAILDEQECDQVLAEEPYLSRLEPRFQSLGSAYNEGEQQEIEMVMFDAMDGEDIIAEDLWLKVSWLSFHDQDPSLRFRFSFGIDHEEDVSADPLRQQLAADLSDCVFPESNIITGNLDLSEKLKVILDSETPHFVERIYYFNAPNGGAYLHHDLERGHAGVVFAQLTGRTFWLALPKKALVEEIIAFSKYHPWPESLTLEMRQEMSNLLLDRSYLSEELSSFSNSTLIHLINETEEFVQFLITRGHSKQLVAGDVLLLPQTTEDTCCWHSVFCSDDKMGQALSFAIRPGSK
jgi:hypothetical protein